MLTEDDKNKIREIESEVIRTIPFWENPRLISFLNFLQLLVFAFGIPFSLYTYHVNSQKEREDKRYLIYDSMDKKYWEYEELASRYPQLGLSDAIVTDSSFNSYIKPDSLLTGEEKIISVQLLYLLISLHERAYLLYSDSDNEFMQDQGVGWKNDLRYWIKKKKFRDAWENGGEDFDKNFQKHLNALIAESEINQ